MSTFAIENNNITRSEIKSMILASLPPRLHYHPAYTSDNLIKFDSTFTLNPYEDIIIENIIQPEVTNVVSKIKNYSRRRKSFSYFIDKSGDRKPELVVVVVFCFVFYFIYDNKTHYKETKTKTKTNK